MGLFDKLKKSIGKTGVKLEWRKVENPFKFTDPMIKASILVKAEGDAVTVIGITGKFVARRTNHEGVKEEIELGKEVQKPNENHSTTRNGESVPIYPCKIASGGEEGFGYFVGIRNGMDLQTSLAKWDVSDPASAKANGVTFHFIGEVDIEETAFLFDPSLEEEIEVY